MRTFAERLIAAMTAAGLSQGQLAERIGLSQPAIQKMTSGKTNGSRKMVELSRALNVRPEWLSSGRGTMHYEDTLPSEKERGKIGLWDKNTSLPEGAVEIPVLKDIEFVCGDGKSSGENHSDFKLRFSKATLCKAGVNTDGSGVLCFPARGNSMEPNIPDSTTVAVNTKDKKIVDGKMYAINEDGWKRIKLLYRTGPEMISIRSYNSAEYPPEDKKLGDIEIIGRVFWWAVLDY